MQDAKGFMWFLTDKGMVKYNGKTFKTFTTKQGLPNNDVWDAFTTPDGKIWYLSKSTRLGYIENDSVLSFPNQNKNEIINPIFSIQIENEVYPSGPKEIFQLKDTIWEIIKTPKSDSKAQDIFRVFNSDVSYLGVLIDKDILNLYDADKKIIKQFSGQNIFHQRTTRGQVTDSLFFWASEKMYAFLNLKTLEFKSFNFKDEVGIETIKYPRINLVANKIQISGDRFVGVLDTDFHIKKPFYFPEHLDAHFGLIDNQNTIWLATFAKGVHKLPQIRQQITYDFKDDKIQKIDVIDNQLFVSVYNKGFYKYNENQKAFDPYIESKAFAFGVSKVEALNTIYFLNETNLVTEHNGKRNVVSFNSDAAFPNHINSFVKDVTFFNTDLYGIYPFGLYKIDYKTLDIKNQFYQKGCNDLLVFNSQLIIATNNGVSELKNDSIQSVTFKNEVFNKSVLSITPLSETEILINTDGYGSYISDLNTIKPLDGSEFLIVQDAFIKGNAIWLATNTGVLHFEKTAGNFKLKRSYSINDGLPNNNVNTIFVNDTDLFIGTNSGLAILPINQAQENLLIDVFIENPSYNNQAISNKHSRFKYTSNNTVNFEFSSIDFSEDKSGHSTFNYKLEPLQAEWIHTTTNSISFNNLQPGNYTFHVKNKTIAKQINFKITALWWQTFWFKLLAVLLGVLCVVVISRYIIKKSEFKKNKKIFEDKRLIELQLKALRSQMNPHFVFNSLAAIQFYINENNFEASEMYLVKFSKLIRQFFELSKENEISLVSEISLLQSYLEIEKLRFKEKLNFKIHVDDDLYAENTKIPTMLLQPIIENAINHGIFNKEDNGEVIVNFKKEENQTLIVEIIDDGVGFVNTNKDQSGTIKSSNVLKDRLHFLNNSKKWNISYVEEEVYPNRFEKGNKSIFVIQKL